MKTACSQAKLGWRGGDCGVNNDRGVLALVFYLTLAAGGVGLRVE